MDVTGWQMSITGYRSMAVLRPALLTLYPVPVLESIVSTSKRVLPESQP